MHTKIYAAFAALGLAVGVSADTIQYADLPAAVQKTINRSLNGGIVQEIERETSQGRTYYEVEIRREGKNKEIRVDADGKLLADDARLDGSVDVDTRNNNVDVDVDTRNEGNRVFNKNDGKILGVFNNPRDDKGVEAEASIGDNGVKVETNIDKPNDQGVTEDILDKNDGKILNVLPAPGKNNDASIETEADLDLDRNDRDVKAEVDVDVDDDKVAVDANAGEGKGIFRKGDGKILGIPVPGRTRDADTDTSVDITADDSASASVEGRLDTDKNDGRILGAPKRGFETLTLNDMPPVVRETIQREAGGYRIAEIESATLDGQRVYEVDIERDGKNRELHVSANGAILKDSDREALGAPATGVRGKAKSE